MKKMVRHSIFLVLLVIQPLADVFSQCAMCRATVENNVSNGEVGIGAGLNFGILYLFVTPYILIGLVGFLWYKNSKANAKKLQLNKRNIRQ